MSFDNNNDRIVSGLICDKDIAKIKEAVCIQVEKVYDSCKEKDCIRDQRVLFRYPERVQRIINNSINVKCRKAEVVDVYADVEPVPFKRGFFTVDVKFFIKVTLDFFVSRLRSGTRIVTVPGIVLFDKKVILFGSEGNIKIFKSRFRSDSDSDQIRSALQQDNQPVAKIEVAEPICLNARIQDIMDKFFDDSCFDQLPRGVVESLEVDNFDDSEIADVEGAEDRTFPTRRVVATIGLFSIIKLVRNVQLLVPAFDFCVPSKQCVSATDEDPCELFDSIDFPVDEFFPPQKFDFPRALEEEEEMLRKAME
ncbi:MAG TPA: hypothetical protein GXX37_11200 [Clostridiaceae bacterium]|nr:hypothetical protein [Clostridiaceae bacterium]